MGMMEAILQQLTAHAIPHINFQYKLSIWWIKRLEYTNMSVCYAMQAIFYESGCSDFNSAPDDDAQLPFWM